MVGEWLGSRPEVANLDVKALSDAYYLDKPRRGARPWTK